MKHTITFLLGILAGTIVTVGLMNPVLIESQQTAAATADSLHHCRQQVEAQREHFRDCAWIAHEQIDQVTNGHWIRLRLDLPAYTHIKTK